MDNYQDWQQYKSYEGHLQRLKQISQKSDSYRSNKKNKHKTLKTHNKQILSFQSKQQSQNYSSRKQQQKLLLKYKTEPVFKKTQMLRSPIPLVSSKEGDLIKSALNSKSISLKDKQKILENYLLSKRILETKSVIKPLQIKRQFRLHKKISQNMSKSRKASSYSQKRSQSFQQFEKQKEEDTLKMIIGEGRNYFDLKIKQILLIKGVIVKNSNILYNLKLIVGKNHYQIRALDYNSLFNELIRIKFKKSILINNPQIIILLSMMRQNHEIEIGTFKPVIGNFISKKNQIYKITKGKFPSGTIDIQGKTTYFINPINPIN